MYTINMDIYVIYYDVIIYDLYYMYRYKITLQYPKAV